MVFLETLVLVVLLRTCQAEYGPILTVEECTRDSVVVRLTGAENGGIIYVQGQGSSCKQTTFTRISTYTFDFATCNIEWGETFRLVVQRKAQYQTGHDKQFPVTCLADLDDLDVTNGITIAAKDDEALQTITVKPSATMRLQKNGRYIGGAPVKLGDVITMELKLATEYIKDFDIRAKSCTASVIDIISAYCAVDPDLFPEFTRVSRGMLSSTFGAFRTTDLMGGAVRMVFSCVLQVCPGDCHSTHCPGGYTGFGKRKRRTTTAVATPNQPEEKIKSLKPRHRHHENETYFDDKDSYSPSIRKDEEKDDDIVAKMKVDRNETDVEDLTVEGILEIAQDEVLISKDFQKESKVCLDMGVSVSIILFMTVGLVAMVIAAWIITKRSTKERSVPKYCTCDNEDF